MSRSFGFGPRLKTIIGHISFDIFHLPFAQHGDEFDYQLFNPVKQAAFQMTK
jgi:hypothetical protein